MKSINKLLIFISIGIILSIQNTYAGLNADICQIECLDSMKFHEKCNNAVCSPDWLNARERSELCSDECIEAINDTLFTNLPNKCKNRLKQSEYEKLTLALVNQAYNECGIDDVILNELLTKAEASKISIDEDNNINENLDDLIEPAEASEITIDEIDNVVSLDDDFDSVISSLDDDFENKEYDTEDENSDVDSLDTADASASIISID